MSLFKINTAHAQNQCFHFFCFEYVNIPMIILNEHMHLNMIDVYKKNRSSNMGISPTKQALRSYPWISKAQLIPRRSFLLPTLSTGIKRNASLTEIRFSVDSSMRFFSPTK